MTIFCAHQKMLWIDEWLIRWWLIDLRILCYSCAGAKIHPSCIGSQFIIFIFIRLVSMGLISLCGICYSEKQWQIRTKSFAETMGTTMESMQRIGLTKITNLTYLFSDLIWSNWPTVGEFYICITIGLFFLQFFLLVKIVTSPPPRSFLPHKLSVQWFRPSLRNLCR